MHSEPMRFQEEALDIIQVMSEQMGLAVENAKLYADLAKAKMEVEAYSNVLKLELEKGRKIQREFLPKQLPRIKNLDIAAIFRPALQISGDFYDVFTLPENLWGSSSGTSAERAW